MRREVPSLLMQSITHLNLNHWLQHFRQNQENRNEPDWDAPMKLSGEPLSRLRQSMMEFRLGDGGGPAWLIAHNAKAYTHQSEQLLQVVAAWFKEEEGHARLLGDLVDYLGGGRIHSHWSFKLFCFVRWLMGVEFELQILTVTELSSTAYYQLVRRSCPDPVVRKTLSLILRDEAGHLAFHQRRLAGLEPDRSWIGRKWHRFQFWASGLAAATVLWASHHHCPRAFGASHRSYFRSVIRLISCFLARVERGPSLKPTLR